MAALAATIGRSTTSLAWAPPGRPLAHTDPAALPASLARPAFPRTAHLCDPPHLTAALVQACKLCKLLRGQIKPHSLCESLSGRPVIAHTDAGQH